LIGKHRMFSGYSSKYVVVNLYVQHGNIDPTLLDFKHRLLHCEIGGLDSRVITR